MSAPLKPCPFCGGEAHVSPSVAELSSVPVPQLPEETFSKFVARVAVYERIGLVAVRFAVVCEGCVTRFEPAFDDHLGVPGFASERVAIESWNRREVIHVGAD